MSTSINFQQARANMVEQQIRPWEVLDQRVLDAMEQMRRDEFVPEAYRSLAYADIMVPLEDGQTMLEPRVEARMLQALELTPDDRVLEVGTGSGWVTALLARLAGRVYSVDVRSGFVERARERLAAAENVTIECRDGLAGWEAHAPFDAIALSGSVPALDEGLRRQLAVGGRLFAIVGDAPAMEAVKLLRIGEEQWSTESLFETVAPRLDGVREPERFIL